MRRLSVTLLLLTGCQLPAEYRDDPIYTEAPAFDEEDRFYNDAANSEVDIDQEF